MSFLYHYQKLVYDFDFYRFFIKAPFHQENTCPAALRHTQLFWVWIFFNVLSILLKRLKTTLRKEKHLKDKR